MRKIFTLILGVLFVSAAFAQLERPTAVIKKATVKPVIDGVFDEVWATTDSFAIDRPYDTANGAPTLGEPGETYWKALWDQDGYYLIVKVTDDNYWPNYLHPGGGNAWEYDKPEIYFDVNFVLEDQAGPSAGGSGHHQMAPDLTAAKENGNLNTEDNGRQHAFKVEKPNYVAEYFVPWTSLTTKDGTGVDIEGEIGFDVTINDSDEDNNTRRRAVWANVGPDASEAWVNMDACGKITLEGAQVVYVTDVNISVDGAITEDNQKLQINVEVLPEDATVKSVKWKIRKADPNDLTPVRATISASGLITPLINEELIIYATSADDFIESEEITVSITGQISTAWELSVIKNGNFSVNGKDTTQFWNGINNSDESIIDGYVSIPCVPQTNRWDIMLQQSLNDINDKNAGDTYTFKFKAWGSNALDTIPLILEDYVNGYAKNALLGDVPTGWTVHSGSDVEIPLTDVPQWFEFPVTFPNWVNASSKYSLSFQIGSETGTFNFDSLTFINNADLKYLSTAISQVRAIESFKVYPNPATSKLNVELSAINSKVEIFNSVGVKMDEAVVFGNRHSFDVSSYAKGLYFVRANGAVVKFVK